MAAPAVMGTANISNESPSTLVRFVGQSTSMVSLHVPASTSQISVVVARMQAEIPQAQNVKDVTNRRAIIAALQQCV